MESAPIEEEVRRPPWTRHFRQQAVPGERKEREDMRRFAFAAAAAVMAFAGTASAVVSPNSLQGAQPPSVPEPGAALLFAVGVGVSAWAMRRRAGR